MIEKPKENKPNDQNIINKRKKIILISEDNKHFEVEFINEINKLLVEAKSQNEILPQNFSDTLTLEYIKQIKLFNDDYNSIDECLSEMELEKTKLEIKEDKIIVKVPLYSRRYPEIIFPLKKKDKNTNDKINDLFELFKKMKDEQEKEVKSLKERINYLEDLLKIRKNTEIKNSEEFKGFIITIKCLGNNEFDNYFDTSYIPNTNKIFFSFSFSCKNEKDINLTINSFNQNKNRVYSKDGEYIFTRVKNKKIFFDIAPNYSEEQEKVVRDPFFDLLGEEEEKERNYDLLKLFFGIGHSLTIKTNVSPYNLFEEFDEKKILKFILDAELEFEKISPQIQLFTLFFYILYQKFNFSTLGNFTKALFKDIFLNIMSGNYKYKIPEKILNKYNYNNDVEDIFEFFKEYTKSILIELFKIKEFKDWKLLDFNEIDFYLVSQLHKSGFSFNFKLPKFNDLIDDLLKGKFDN